MSITSETQALDILDDLRQAHLQREAAARHLAEHPTPRAIARLVRALQDDDFGVRWDAAVALARLGNLALPELLRALTDPSRVGDPRLREGVYHALHYNQSPHLPVPVRPLMEALRGPAADIASMDEASRLLQQIERRDRRRVAGRG